MFPLPIISNTKIIKFNTIVTYLKTYSGVPVNVFGTSSTIQYEPSTLYYTDGYNAIRMLGATSYVQIGNNGIPTKFAIGNSTNFSIESYVYLTSTDTQMLVGNLLNSMGSGSYWVSLNNTYQIPSQISIDGYSTTGTVQRFRFGTSTTKLPTNQWIKIKLERVGSLLSFYLNDVQVGSSQTMTLGFTNTYPNVMKIGCTSDNQFQLLGAIDSFRFSTTNI